MLQHIRLDGRVPGPLDGIGRLLVRSCAKCSDMKGTSGITEASKHGGVITFTYGSFMYDLQRKHINIG